MAVRTAEDWDKPMSVEVTGDEASLIARALGYYRSHVEPGSSFRQKPWKSGEYFTDAEVTVLRERF
jgi:hypothetical protein